MGDEGSRLSWAVRVRLQSDRTRFDTSRESQAPKLYIRGYDTAEGAFAIVGDTGRGRIALWFGNEMLPRFAEKARAASGEDELVIQAKDEIWRPFHYRAAMNDDVKSKIAPLLS